MTSLRTPSHRVATLVVLALVCLSALAPAVSAAATDLQDTGTGAGVYAADGKNTTTTPTSTPTNASNRTNGTVHSGPTQADQTRISAVSFDREYLKTKTTGEHTYNISGPYAVFASSHSIEAAKITQPKAQAKVMDGGRTVRVEFAKDAAPKKSQSYYELKLYFADGSSLSIDLYASHTSQIVVSAEMKEATGFIQTMKEDAKEHGYEPTIDGIEAYHSWEKDQADLLSNFLSPKLERLFFAGFAFIQSSLAIIGLATAFILGALYIRRVHGWKVEDMVNGGNRTDQKRQEFSTHYRETHDKAAAEPLHKVDAIGKRYEGVILDTAGDRTVKQWADRLAYGEPVRNEDGTYARDDDGNVVYRHNGIDDLVGTSSLRETWAEPYLRDELMGDAQTFATIAKQTLERMADHHCLRQYDGAASKARSLVEQVQSGDANRYDEQTTWSQSERSNRFGAGPTGGDD